MTVSTLPVVWRCPHCNLPVQVTARLESTTQPNMIRVEMTSHINVHMRQHTDD